jgi:hypothetical protein
MSSDSDLGEHLATFSREHHEVLSDDANYYLYSKRPKRQATTDGPTRLDRLSQRLKAMNEKNREFWSERRR